MQRLDALSICNLAVKHCAVTGIEKISVDYIEYIFNIQRHRIIGQTHLTGNLKISCPRISQRFSSGASQYQIVIIKVRYILGSPIVGNGMI